MRFIVEKDYGEVEEFDPELPPCKGAWIEEKKVSWETKGLDGIVSHEEVIQSWQIELESLDDLIGFIYRCDCGIRIEKCSLAAVDGYWNLEKIVVV